MLAEESEAGDGALSVEEANAAPAPLRMPQGDLDRVSFDKNSAPVYSPQSPRPMGGGDGDQKFFGECKESDALPPTAVSPPPHPRPPLGVIHSAPIEDIRRQKAGEGRAKRGRRRPIYLLRRLLGIGGGNNGVDMAMNGHVSGSSRTDEALQWMSMSPVVRVADDEDDDDESEAIGVTSARRRRSFLWNLFSCLSPRNEVQYEVLEEYAKRIPHMRPDYSPKFPLLEPPSPELQSKITLVLDLDETLVHSSFEPMPDADFVIPLDMQGETHMVYVRKRPMVDKFLRAVHEWYEVIVFTASLALYANPVVDMLDPEGLIHKRLYREHCALYGEFYVKDIGKLGRDIKKTIIVDNSPLSYVLQPENAFPISGFTNDMNDRELVKILKLLEKARKLDDVRDAYS